MVRAARKSDARAIAELSETLGYPTTEEEARRRLERLQSSSGDAVFVAEVGSRGVSGWIHVFVAERLESGRFAEVGGLVVAEAHRRSGVGGLLLEGAESWARKRGCATLRVRSNVVREDAHRFYETRGFSRVKSQVVLAKTLD